jgi:predicted TIM-barrel fold metal-dependent hydrolase
MWASGFPTVTFEQSLADVKALELREHVRPKYLRENALRLYRF